MPGTKSDHNEKRSLSDLSSDCLMLILQLRVTKELGDAVVLRQKIKNLLAQLERNAKLAGIDSEEAQQAKFVLAAFIDESILGSEWSRKHEWAKQPLQLEIFNIFNAGEEFFTRLERLRQRAQANAAVLEVYYLCLALGFRGKYIFNPEQLKGVIEELYHDLRRVTGKSAELLSPHGKPRDVIKQAVKQRVPAWVVGVAAVSIGFFFYLTMTFFIEGKAGEVVTAIQGIQ